MAAAQPIDPFEGILTNIVGLVAGQTARMRARGVNSVDNILLLTKDA